MLMPHVAEAANAVLTWANEPEVGITAIAVQRMENDQWARPETVYRSKEFNVAPSVGSDEQGTALLVWQSTSTVRSILRYSFKRQGAWQKVGKMPDQGGEVTTPAVIFDHNNSAWVFWVSDQNGLDDVYYRRWSAVNQRWSSIEMANDKNSVPDILPEVQLDKQGDVVLTWRQYDGKTGSYVKRSKVYYVGNRDDSVAQTDFDDNKELTSGDIKLPDDWVSVSRAVMHFPNNRRQRHEVLIQP